MMDLVPIQAMGLKVESERIPSFVKAARDTAGDVSSGTGESLS